MVLQREGVVSQVRTQSCTLIIMESEFFDMASKKPVAIARGGDRFVLMNEKEYLNLKDEVLSLQRNLISMLEVRDGKSETYRNAEEGFGEIFDNISAKVKKKKSEKKVMGE